MELVSILLATWPGQMGIRSILLLDTFLSLTVARNTLRWRERSGCRSLSHTLSADCLHIRVIVFSYTKMVGGHANSKTLPQVMTNVSAKE